MSPTQQGKLCCCGSRLTERERKKKERVRGVGERETDRKARRSVGGVRKVLRKTFVRMLTSLQCSRLTHQGIMEKMKLEAGLQLLPRCWSWDEMSRDSRVYVRGLQKAENPMYTYLTIPRG